MHEKGKPEPPAEPEKPKASADGPFQSVPPSPFSSKELPPIEKPELSPLGTPTYVMHEEGKPEKRPPPSP